MTKEVLDDDVDGVSVRIDAAIAAVRDQLTRDNDDGKTFYMICPCQKDAVLTAGFMPVLTRNGPDLSMSMLVCLECGKPGYFEEGRLIWAEDGAGVG